MKRVLAAVVALAMVGGSLWLRDRMDAGEVAGPGTGSSGPATLVCARDLEEACRALGDDRGDLEIVVEDAATTYERLVAGGDTGDLWLVPAPWPEMVEVASRRGAGTGRFPGGGGESVARSPLVLVAVEGTSAADACVAEPTWRCPGGVAAAGGRVLWPDPAATATGRLALGAVTVGWFGDPEVAVNDFDDPYEQWRAELVRTAQRSAAPVGQLLQSPAFADLAVSTEAEWQRRAAAAAPGRVEPLRLLYPEPVATVDVVLAPIDGGSVPDELRDAASAALTARGWRGPGGGGGADLPGGAPSALADATNLPSAGVLVNLGQALG